MLLKIVNEEMRKILKEKRSRDEMRNTFCKYMYSDDVDFLTVKFFLFRTHMWGLGGPCWPNNALLSNVCVSCQLLICSLFDECKIEFCCPCWMVLTTRCSESLVVKPGVNCQQRQLSLTWCHGIRSHRLNLRSLSYFASACLQRLAMLRTTLLGFVFIVMFEWCYTVITDCCMQQF